VKGKKRTATTAATAARRGDGWEVAPRRVFGVGAPRSINYLKRMGKQETETHREWMYTRP